MSAAAPWRSRIVGHDSVPPAELVPNPENWRSHPQAQRDALGGALEDVGWVTEVIVNKATGHLVDGHLRLDIALSRNEPLVPVTYVDLTEDEERLVLATLDPLAAMADAEIIPLGELLEQLNPENAALRSMLDNLADQYGLNEPKVGLTDPDDVPDLGEETHIKRGDLFALGDHRLMCGDSTQGEDVARLMGGMKAACMWTDPPYGVDYVGKTKDALKIDNDTADGLTDLLDASFAVATKALEPGAPVYVARPAGVLGIEFLHAWVRAGWQLHEELVWVKDTMVLGHSDYHYRHEPIIYGWTAGPGRSGRGRHEGTRWYGPHSATSVFEVDRPKASRDHPIGKPVALVEAMLGNSTVRGGVVYEPFNGSGSTIIAAEQLSRRCYAMEIDPRYVAVAIERWENFTGKQAEQINGG